MWLESLDEAIRLYELGQEIYVSPRGQWELLLGGESGEGRNKRRRAAEEGEGNSYYQLDLETGVRKLLGGLVEAYTAYLEGEAVLVVEPVLGQTFKLGQNQETGELTFEPWLAADEESDDDDDYDVDDDGMEWDKLEAESYEERNPERLIRLYLDDPGKGTMSDLGLIAGASFTENYVDEKMMPEERERWNS